jgi:hypothetical protein
MNKHKIILKLLYKSSGWLLKLSFLSLPIALFLSISSYLFIDNLLTSYERYLENAYLGIQGRISVETSDKRVINGVKEYAEKNHLLYSIKKEFLTSIVFFNNKKSLSKSAKFIVLNKNYIKEKFHQKNITDNTIFINQIFLKSMGGLNIDKFKKVYFDDKNKTFLIDKYISVDTGFLTSKPIIFMSDKFANKLFGKVKSDKKVIEFLEKDKKVIANIKDKVKQLAKEYATSELKINDLLFDTKVTKEFFKKVTILQNSISFLIFILSLGIIIMSISISIEFKKSSLKILQLIGMSSKELSLTISGVIFLMIISVLGISMLLLRIFQNIFISVSSFKNNFFIPLDYNDVLIILFLGFILSLISFFTTKYIFKGGK